MPDACPDLRVTHITRADIRAEQYVRKIVIGL